MKTQTSASFGLKILLEYVTMQSLYFAQPADEFVEICVNVCYSVTCSVLHKTYLNESRCSVVNTREVSNCFLCFPQWRSALVNYQFTLLQL